jgi:hypothetical protein
VRRTVLADDHLLDDPRLLGDHRLLVHFFHFEGALAKRLGARGNRMVDRAALDVHALFPELHVFLDGPLGHARVDPHAAAGHRALPDAQLLFGDRKHLLAAGAGLLTATGFDAGAVRLQQLLDASGPSIVGVDGQNGAPAAQSLAVVIHVVVPGGVGLVGAEEPAPEPARAALAVPLVLLARRRIGDAHMAPIDAFLLERLRDALGLLT